MAGPLQGVRILEFAGIGPGPFAAMMLADHGAEVIRLARKAAPLDWGDPARAVLNRSRAASLTVDLKQPEGVALARELARGCDGLLEGYRPGVMERLGLGPDALLQENPRLVYGRMTGWGQTGPWAGMAGHDLDYIALAGVLGAVGPAEGPPAIPLNLVGDFGGGGMMLAFGMVCALLAAQRTGRGQVVDAAITDGSALLMAVIWQLRAQGLWRDQRGVNVLDGAAPFYGVYQTADGGWLAVGPLEPQFWGRLLDRLGLTDDPAMGAQLDPARWPAMRARLAEVFRTRDRDDWMQLFEGTDCCVAPVLSMEEAAAHPHNAGRGTFVEAGGVTQPAPAPRYSATPSRAPVMPAADDPVEALERLGIEAERAVALAAAGVVA